VLVPLIVVYVLIMNFYRASARELQRLTSGQASPIYAMFGETLNGLATERAYDRAEQLQLKNAELLGALLRPQYLQRCTEVWLDVRLQLLGCVLNAATAGAFVWHCVGGECDVGMAGFSMQQALIIVGCLHGLVHSFASAESKLVAMERLHAMQTVTQEAPLEISTDPTPPWPTQGKIEFDDVWMAYRPGLNPVLKGVNFTVNPGEKVGIVGRRGAGKSSILMALFRLTELQRGSIRIDGQDAAKLGLGLLRQGLAIIPQDPTLFTGTLRSNLDPTGQLSDTQLKQAVVDVGLWKYVSQCNGQLDMTIESKGENLACGQRQLVCLARALLLGAKVLVLDEATASVDQACDDQIQTKLRDLKGVTMLTIAHRLDTIIDYDRVAVMSEGVVVEYDAPKELASKPGSVFGQMWRQYNIRSH